MGRESRLELEDDNPVRPLSTVGEGHAEAVGA